MLHLHNRLRVSNCALPRFLMRRGIVLCLLAISIPLITIVICGLFFGTHKSVEQLITSSSSRNSRIQANAIAFAITQAFNETRNQLLVLASGNMGKEEMKQRMQLRSKVRDILYREVAYTSVSDPKDRYLLLNYNEDIFNVPPDLMEGIGSSPFILPNNLHTSGEVSISPPTEIIYPVLSTKTGLKNSISLYVIRLTTPVIDASGTVTGFLTLSLDIDALRKIVCTYTRDNFDDEYSADKVRILYIDSQGWMIFQGETNPTENQPLRLDDVRAGFQGDFGRPGFSTAFRPNGDYYNYWTMVNEAQHQRSGQLRSWEGNNWSDYSLPIENVSYAPIIYQSQFEGTANVVGCIAIINASFSSTQIGNKLFRIYLIATTLAILLLSFAIWLPTSCLAAVLRKLRYQVEDVVEQTHSEEIGEEDSPKEITKLRHAINKLITQVRFLENLCDDNNDAVQNKLLLEKTQRIPTDFIPPSDGIIGESEIIQELKQSISQAAKVMEDVLIIGETGTGKELVSRAIHTQSNRKDGPFITINCGALDESLLMDTLFGHVKGAYTEAKNVRKGAFLAAEGGTLMLDEIGTASPRVQQALLRALSDRCIHPLGSDQFVRFNTRVIAATNAELSKDAKSGSFREDLYFRLAVITIRTTPLRLHKQDIPELIASFLKEGSQRTGIENIPSVSRGAMSVLMHYHWPGNIRELRNCILRALTFCEGKMILPEHLSLHPTEVQKQAILPFASLPEEDEGCSCPWTPDTENKAEKEENRPPLNPRISEILPEILSKEKITRQEYQDLAGNISPRTAQYDLQTLVELGILKKQGKGPSLHYIVLHN